MKNDKLKYILNLKIYLFFVVLFHSSIIYGQKCNTIKDSLYLINFEIREKGKQTYFGEILIENLDSLIINKQSSEKFICSIFSNTKYIIPPPINFESNIIDCYGDSAKYYYDIEVFPYFNGLKEIEKKLYLRDLLLNDGAIVILKISKLYGLFWKFSLNGRDINNISNQVIIPEECYNHIYIYAIKKFISILKLKRYEKQRIKKIIL